MSIETMAAAAKRASHQMARISTEKKNEALNNIIAHLQRRREDILQANLHDIEEAKAANLSEAMIDRLSIQNRLDGILADIANVVRLPDPVGECFEEQEQGQLCIKKCRTPLGVLGVIYESRPNITIDISALTIKSGNCAILRGGSESLRTNKILVQCVQEGLSDAKLPVESIQLVQTTDRTEVQKMLRLHDSIDLIIPRGGAALHKFCRENSTIPVITGGVGVCHLYVDESADLAKALPVIVNAKTQRPTVCNALDTLLVHENVANVFVPQVIQKLGGMGVRFRLDKTSMEIAAKDNLSGSFTEASAADWATEWLDLILGIKVVKDLDEAIAHIVEYSTGHSDGILTETPEHADRFVAEVDSAAVYVNASTRFTDGSELGLGAEVAISTQKLHARGPMGLRELTSYKWVISGDYTVRK